MRRRAERGCARGRAAPAAVFLLLAACSRADPPANDDIAQAQWVRTLIRFRSNSSTAAVAAAYPGGDAATAYLSPQRPYDFVNFSAAGTNEQATMELDEPSHGTHFSGIDQLPPPPPHSQLGPALTDLHFYRQTEKSVWWKWKAPVNATMRLTTEGSSFDTALGVYTRVHWDGVTASNQFGVKEIARGDDVWWNERLQSEVDFVANAGVTYYIAVGGFRGASGDVKLVGRVESWIYPPVKIDRVATPVFELDMLGKRQDSTRVKQSKFVSVSISCATPGAQIFYTTDGLMPDVLPTMTQGLLPQATTKRFSVPFKMRSITIRAVAYVPGLRRSLLATSTAFQLQADVPVILPDGGEYEVVQEVRILPTTDEDGDSRAVIHYTLDGREPDLSSPLYAGSILLRNVSNATLRARVWHPGEWAEDGRVGGLVGLSTAWVPGMAPSAVAVSKPFTVKERLPVPALPSIYGEVEPMVLKGGNPPLAAKTFTGSATIQLSIDDTAAEIWYAFALTIAGVQSWTRYSGPVQVSEVGKHWIHVRGQRQGYTDSYVSDYFSVQERIRVVQPNVPFLETVHPGQYKYYTLNLTEVGTDVMVSVTKFFGSVDIFFSARQRRPNMHNHSLSATSMTAEGGLGGQRLLALHTDEHLGMQVIDFRNSTCPLCPFATPIVVGILGVGTTPTTVLVNIKLETSPVIRLSILYRRVVEIGAWTYFKLYIGNSPEPTRRGLVVRAWQTPAAFVGLRIALRQGDAPSSDLTDTAYTMFGDSQGYYEFTVPISSPSRAPWFVGVQGLVPIEGLEILNFTFAVSPMIESDELFPGRSFAAGFEADPYGRPGLSGVPTARTEFYAQEITEGVSVKASVRVGRFAFFRLRITRSLRWLDVRVFERRFSNGLRIYAQNGVPPSLVSHITQNVTTGLVLENGVEGYSYRAPAYEGKDFYIGVYGFSYDFQNMQAADTKMREPLYHFTITASTAPRLSGLGLPEHRNFASTYRFFFAFKPAGEYAYYSIPHTDVSKDLHIVVRIAAGVVDVVVSNTVKYPKRTELENVGWSSMAAADGGMSVNIHTYDPGFKTGVFYVGLFAQSNADFGIAAYTESTSFLLELSKAYRIQATTYSVRYFRFKVEKVYDRLTVIFREETSGLFMTALFMQGQKPSDVRHLWYSNTPDEEGNMRYELLMPQIDEYYLMVHFFKTGYTGPVFSHTYTIDVRVDDHDKPGYEAVRDTRREVPFRVARNQRYENLRLPRPPSWDFDRPSFTSSKVRMIEMTRPQTAAFLGEQWVYYSVYVSSFSSVLTVTARALSKGLSFSLVVRRSYKPTLFTYIDKAEMPNEHGEYTVRAPSPVTGGLYYIGVHASVLDMKEARFVIIASTDPGVTVVPTVTVLRNYFVAADTVPALEYRYYKIYLPEDERDVAIEVTHQFGETDIVISNVDPWPTLFNYNASKPGWWKTEAVAGGGKRIAIRNFERGYKSPATYYVGIFSKSFTSYYVIARLDRPPPTVPLGSMFRSQVAEMAFSTFRFPVGGMILSRLVFVVKLQRPYNTGLALYAKRNEMPTILDYEIRTDVSTYNGEFFLDIDLPRPEDVYYVGVFGLAAGLLPRGANYYFLGTILSKDMFMLYESSPYTQDPPLVPPPGNYIPPPITAYTILPPDVPFTSRLLNNGTFQFFRLQVSELTRVTAIAGETKPYSTCA